jgi:hypothetical protein
MSLGSARGRLTGITRDLSLKWDDTKNYWRDGKSQEFERRFMRELFAEVNQSLLALEKLDELLRKIRSNCE